MLQWRCFKLLMVIVSSGLLLSCTTVTWMFRKSKRVRINVLWYKFPKEKSIHWTLVPTKQPYYWNLTWSCIDVLRQSRRIGWQCQNAGWILCQNFCFLTNFIALYEWHKQSMYNCICNHHHWYNCCAVIGARQLQCDASGQCHCKPGVTGDKCDRCQANYFDFGITGCRYDDGMSWNWLVTVLSHEVTELVNV